MIDTSKRAELLSKIPLGSLTTEYSFQWGDKFYYVLDTSRSFVVRRVDGDPDNLNCKPQLCAVDKEIETFLKAEVERVKQEAGEVDD